MTKFSYFYINYLVLKTNTHTTGTAECSSKVEELLTPMQLKVSVNRQKNSRFVQSFLEFEYE